MSRSKLIMLLLFIYDIIFIGATIGICTFVFQHTDMLFARNVFDILAVLVLSDLALNIPRWYIKLPIADIPSDEAWLYSIRASNYTHTNASILLRIIHQFSFSIIHVYFAVIALSSVALNVDFKNDATSVVFLALMCWLIKDFFSIKPQLISTAE